MSLMRVVVYWLSNSFFQQTFPSYSQIYHRNFWLFLAALHSADISKNKTAAANRLRLLQFNNDDHCPVIVVHFALFPEQIFNCTRIQGKLQNGSEQRVKTDPLLCIFHNTSLAVRTKSVCRLAWVVQGRKVSKWQNRRRLAEVSHVMSFSSPR